MAQVKRIRNKTSGNSRRKKANVNPSSLSSKLRLGGIFVAAALVSILLAETVVFVHTLYHRESDLLDEMTSHVTTVVRAATIRNTLTDLTEKKTIEILEKLVAMVPVMGGRLYDTLGDPAGSFGVEPELSRRAVASSGLQALRSANGNYYDIYLSQAHVGLPFDLILRLDTSNLQQLLGEYQQHELSKSLFISGISISIMLILITLLIIQPIIKMRRAISAATLHPERSSNFLLRWRRKDEIGEMGRAIDKLLSTVSSLYQNDLAAARDAIEQAKSPIIQYDHTGRLIAANPAALLLFSAKSVEDMARMDQNFLVLPNRDSDQHYSVTSSVEEILNTPGKGSYMDEGLVVFNGIEIPTLIIARPVHKKNGEILRYFANLVDISEKIFKQNQMASEISRLTMEKIRNNHRIESMKMVLESCIILLEAVKAEETKDDERKSVMADRVVTQWYRDAQDSGLIDQSELEYGILPVVRGRPENLSKLFRQALTLTFMKSSFEKPSLAINTITISKTRTQFTIRDKSFDDGLSHALEDRSLSTEWRICLAAFQKMLALEGGELTDMKEDSEENFVSFILNTAPESSHITSGSEKVVAA